LHSQKDGGDVFFETQRKRKGEDEGGVFPRRQSKRRISSRFACIEKEGEKKSNRSKREKTKHGRTVSDTTKIEGKIYSCVSKRERSYSRGIPFVFRPSGKRRRL